MRITTTKEYWYLREGNYSSATVTAITTTTTTFLFPGSRSKLNRGKGPWGEYTRRDADQLFKCFFLLSQDAEQRTNEGKKRKQPTRASIEKERASEQSEKGRERGRHGETEKERGPPSGGGNGMCKYLEANGV